MQKPRTTVRSQQQATATPGLAQHGGAMAEWQQRLADVRVRRAGPDWTREQDPGAGAERAESLELSALVPPRPLRSDFLCFRR